MSRLEISSQIAGGVWAVLVSQAMEDWILEMRCCDSKAGLFCGSFVRKGKVSAYVESIQTLEDLK